MIQMSNLSLAEVFAVLGYEPDPDEELMPYEWRELQNLLAKTAKTQAKELAFRGEEEIARSFRELQHLIENGSLQHWDEERERKLSNNYLPGQEQEEEEEQEQEQDENKEPGWDRTRLYVAPKDPSQAIKVTSRDQKVEVDTTSPEMPMRKEELGVSNSFIVPVAQDKLNPTLENTTQVMVVVDSQFRQGDYGANAMSTDFLLDLSDSIRNVLSLSLYSFQIPFTWYVIDEQYENNFFWIVNNGVEYHVVIESGNYQPTELVTALNDALIHVGFTPPHYSSASSTGFSYRSLCGKIRARLDGWADPAGIQLQTVQLGGGDTEQFVENRHAYFVFFDPVAKAPPANNNTPTRTTSGTLGWLLGWRLPLQAIFTGGNDPEAVLDLIGPKYFILVLDEFNQNRVTGGLVAITEESKVLPLPKYYSTAQPWVCVEEESQQIQGAALKRQYLLWSLAPSLELYQRLKDKSLYASRNVVPQYLPSAPRHLTQSQLYTINEIIKSRNRTISYQSKPPTSADTFAILPVKKGGTSIGELYADFSGSLQNNKRSFFGPVHISRIRVRLLDDRGRVVNLHGSNWCFSMLVEKLYQY